LCCDMRTPSERDCPALLRALSSRRLESVPGI
jgi:hypothetical protein